MKSRFKSAVILVALSIVVAVSAVIVRQKSRAGRPLLLEGTILTPAEAIPDGWILVRDGKISKVSVSKPVAPDAIEVRTGGIIVPGLIDLHNHVSYDVFPRWKPGRLFKNRYEWRGDPDYIAQVRDPYESMVRESFCDMNTFGELRALVGGTTSILSTASASCIRGLVRNLDFRSGLYGAFERDSAHVRAVIEIRPTTDSATIGSAKRFLKDRGSEALVIHVAEGTDMASLDEFRFVEREGLLTRKTAVVQGVALGPAEFEAMHRAGASLVWSPRSNMELYGQTANISAALDAGVRIALSPDWGITGSSNLLEELGYAARWNGAHLAGRLTDRELVEMVTSIPARIAGVDDEIGAIREGLAADLVVIAGERNQPYRALISASARDVQLVLIDGQPVLGTKDLMSGFWKASGLSDLIVDGRTKSVRLPESSDSGPALVSRLQSASRGRAITSLTEGP